MSSVQTRLFKSNRSQAVRLPKQVAFPESVKDVEITAIGSKRIIAPAGQSCLIKNPLSVLRALAVYPVQFRRTAQRI